MPDKLKGKNVIISGAGQTPVRDIGNGRAMSILFAREGARLFLVARHNSRAQETADIIISENPNARVYTYECDVTDEKSVIEMCAVAKEKMERIDAFVNSVGILSTEDTGIFSSSGELFDTIMDTNVKAALFQLRNVYPYMKVNGGSILQIASVAGTSVYPNDGPILYYLSKCAMIRLGESAAARFASDGIRVNNIVLGLVKTALGIKK